MSIERSKEDKKEKRSTNGLNYPNQNTIINNFLVSYKIWKKYNEIKFKNKMGLNFRKMTQYHPHPPQQQENEL